MVIHNNCTFRIVRYYSNKAVIEVKSIDGGYLEGADENTPSTLYLTENVDSLDSGFNNWVKDNF